MGYELARFFDSKGARLLCIARSQEGCCLLNQKDKFFSCDLSQQSQLDGLARELDSLPIDVLINNAAIQGPIGPVWENDWEVWTKTLSINLTAPVFLCRVLVPKFIKQGGGVIINLSGGGAASPRPYFSAYSAAKAALVRFSETLAHELKDTPVRVNCIAPGPLPTEMLKQILENGADYIDPQEWQQAQKILDNEEDSFARVARLCAFLISDEATSISGRLISALWDPWEDRERFRKLLMDPHFFTLRRVTPDDKSTAL